MLVLHGPTVPVNDTTLLLRRGWVERAASIDVLQGR
jgi:hypothetical protein